MYMSYTIGYMKQLNINVTKKFEQDLRQYMEKLGISQKAEAIRCALHESVEQLAKKHKKVDFRAWLGMGLKAPLSRRPRFKSEDDLWEL